MKKYLKLFIIIFYLPNFANSQILLGKKHEYVYNNSKDTITFKGFTTSFTKVGYNNPRTEFFNQPKIIDSIQIDGKGKKEIVFYLNSIFNNSQHGGSFDIDENTTIGKYEIWNLDTKTMLFEVINYREDVFNRFIAGKPHEKGKELYKYNVQIDELGTITIKKEEIKPATFIENKKKKKKLNSKTPILSVKPESVEGIYKFNNGKYIKIVNQE